MNNIEKYERYQRKSEFTGRKMFNFLLEIEKDRVSIEDYIEDGDTKRRVVIPDFVEYIRDDAFFWVKQNLEIVTNGDKIKSCHKIFESYKGEELGLSEFNTSNVNDMSFMFNGCTKIRELDLSRFDTSKVKDMQYMFRECRKLRKLTVTNFDISKVTNTYGMFIGCNLEILDLSTWKVSQSTNIRGVFLRCGIEELILNKQLKDLLEASNELMVMVREYINNITII